MTQLGGVPGMVVTDQGGFVDPHSEIDSLEFGISPSEAKQLDPHQLMLVEVVFQALEDSGINYRGTKTGVYVTGSPDVHNLGSDMYDMGPYSATGAAFSMQANRLSYLFDLRGPSVYLDTACSSSITALHLARQAIINGDCDQAVVAAVNLILAPHASLSFSTLGTLSPTGLCHTFDASADGYSRGEGCTVVVLQRTEDAERQGSHIYSEVVGSAINANGKGKSITLPDGPQQKAATIDAYKESGRKFTDAVYVECHGTGTPVGDPIEANAVGEIFSPGRAEDDYLCIGSAKTNVGHLEPAAGLVGLIKVCYTLDTGLMLPHLHFENPSPRIRWDDFKIRVLTKTEQMPLNKLTEDGKFVVSLSSFGFGGANSHTVLERRPDFLQKPKLPTVKATDPLLIGIGALSNRAVTSLAETLTEAWPQLADPTSAALLARTMTERARGHPNLAFAVAASGEPIKVSETTVTSSPDFNPIKAFVFCGQGPQHEHMGRHLYARFAAFRDSVHRSFEVIQRYHNSKFEDEYGFFKAKEGETAERPKRDPGSWTVEAIVIGITVFQIALFDLWVDLGVVPDVVMGHSVGEIAAMYASGAFDQEKAIRTAIARSNALSRLGEVPGGMAAIGMSREQAQMLIDGILRDRGLDTGLWVSASNSTNAVSVSGRNELVDAVVESCEKANIFARVLKVGGPYHSPMVSPCQEGFLSEVYPLVDSTVNVPTRGFISTVEGRLFEPGRPLDAQYCWHNVCRPVLFRESIEALHELRRKEDRGLVIIEVAPHPVLGSYMEEISRSVEAERTTIVCSARRPNPKKGETPEMPCEVYQFLTSIGSVMQAGLRDIVVYKLYHDAGYDLPMGVNSTLGKQLPEYPFLPLQKKTHEMNYPEWIRCRPVQPPLCSPMFRINAQTHSWTKGHMIRGTIVFPGAGYAEAALEAGARTITNMAIHRAFVVNEDGAPKYAAFRKTGINGGWEFRSSGKNSVDDAGMVFDTLHASGQMSPEPTPVGPAHISEVFGEDWMRHFDIVMDGETFYSRLRPNGSQHTGAFGMINEVRASSTREDDYIALVDVLPDLWTHREAQGMVFHPGLLDSAFLCTWIPGLPFDDGKLGVDAYLPNLLDILSVRGTPEEIRNAKQLVLYVQTIISNDVLIKHNVLMFDRATGKTLAYLKGLECTRIKDTSRARDAFAEVWEPRFFETPTKPDQLFSLVPEQTNAFVQRLTRLDAELAQPFKEALARGNPVNVAQDELQESLFDDAEFTGETFESVVNVAQNVLSSALERQPRKVFRVLEAYPRHRKVNLQPLVAWAQKRDMYVDVVRLNVATDLRGSPQFFAGPYDVRAASDNFKRTPAAAFDLVVATDLLRKASDPQDAVATLDSLLVPGGQSVYVEVRDDVPQLRQLFYDTPAPNAGALGLTASSVKSPAFNIYFRERSPNAWPNMPVVPTRSVPKQLLRAESKDTLVYHYQPDTEHLLVQQIKEQFGPSPIGKLWIVTDDTDVGSRAVGLAGTISNEIPTLPALLMSFDPSYTFEQREGVLATFFDMMDSDGVEYFNLIKGGHAYGRRLVQQPRLTPLDRKDRNWVLELIEGETPSVQALYPHTHWLPPLGPHDVVVRTDAVALNFKNILSATGLLPATDRLSEWAGYVEDVGSAVSRVRPGDRVMGTSGGVREGTVALAAEYALTKVPGNMSQLEAAAFPIAYGTVWHGLVQLAQIKPGETILIHAAAGGVGLCAIQIAQRHGMEVFCTVSSQEKRDYLHNNLGVPYENMANSRSIGTWTQGGRDWLAKRGRDGFDVVLNSLQGAALQAGIDVLAYLGRFVDISKRDHLAGTPMSMNVFAKAINYIAVELGLLGEHAPLRLAQLLDEVAAEQRREPFKCLVGHRFAGAEGLLESYKLMESGKHIGKIVTDLSEQCKPGAVVKMHPGFKIYDPRKSFILVGGCGGLGPRLAQFLMYQGARNIVLTGRRGRISRSDRLALERLVRDKAFPGTTIKVMAADALNKDAMQDVVDTARSLGPIGGIFMMSVVLRDDQLLNMDEEKFQTVTRSKIGALNVVRELVDIETLDFLFLFSSTAALFFNPGQANYNAAQTFFNRFAQDHRNVVSYAVPAISDIGVYAEMRSKQTNNAAVKIMDSLACTSRELCEGISNSISRVVLNGPNHAGYYIQPMDWSIMYEISPANMFSISHLLEHQDDADDAEGADDAGADPVGQLLGKLLNVDVNTVDDSMFLSALGLDSLSASKLSAILMAEFNVTVTQLQLLGPVSIASLRQTVADAMDEPMKDKPAATSSRPAGVSQPTAQAAVEKKVDVSPLASVDYAREAELLDDPSISAEQLPAFDFSTLDPSQPQRILVTGATGFLGSSALEAVLLAFPNARVSALVRGTPEGAMDRIREVAKRRELRSLEHLDRVEVVSGDVSKPKLGMTDGEWNFLAGAVDLVVHASGRADHVMGYQGIADVNAFSVREVLRLATTRKLKAVCNIGSTNMWLSFSDKRDDRVIKEEVNLNEMRTGLFQGYAQTKWVAEMLCQRARERGVPVITVRPGTLGGNALSRYIPNEDSFMWRLLTGSMQIGKAPKLSDNNISETPADWFSDMFGKLLSEVKTWTSGKTAYHIKSPHGLTLEDLNRRFGQKIVDVVPYDHWIEAVQTELAKPESNNPPAPLRHFLAKNQFAQLPIFDTSNTKEVLGNKFTECPPYAA